MFPVKSGGSGRPENCIPRHRVALIVPFRDREPQLAQFLRHIHPILLRQLLDYRIFLIQQVNSSSLWKIDDKCVFVFWFNATNQLLNEAWQFETSYLTPNSTYELSGVTHVTPIRRYG